MHMKKYITFSGTLLSCLLVWGAHPIMSLAAAVRAGDAVAVRGIVKPRPYEDLISKVARENHLSQDLIHAVVRHESNYNTRARGSHGEIGLMQIKLATARSLGYSGSVRGLYDPLVNLEYGARYLAIAHQLSYGNTCGTILKYNAGHGATRMKPISARYCEKVKAYMASVR